MCIKYSLVSIPCLRNYAVLTYRCALSTGTSKALGNEEDRVLWLKGVLRLFKQLSFLGEHSLREFPGKHTDPSVDLDLYEMLS
ncbi:hypothetical protein L1987_85612 [Smallanthus sonchifolius]|uniref:Uncharacterized protein n=1 Tax=Smallanthus sonchifolius TaxID=185202 RepID=A0ACB8XXL7_9ASTR|nr:hypothetical protein L1987_85612 [Smallanthus sonchifolius]